MRRFPVLALVFGVFFLTNLTAGPKFTYNEGKNNLELFSQAQFWGVGSYDPATVPSTQNRLDFYLRRTRIGLKGSAYPKLDFLTSFAYDNLGKDPFSGTIGSGQKLEMAEFRVWDAYFLYHLDSTWANISFGLQRPVVSREYNNPYTGVPSLEVASTYYYLRDHLTTRPTAREVGVNIGGQYADSNRIWGVVYNAGIFDAAQEKSSELAGSRCWSPLVTGRLGVSLGQPESRYHKLSYDLNAFGKRKGCTIAGYAAYQGHVDERYDTAKCVFDSSKGTYSLRGYKGGFRNNSTMGVDLLANYMGLTLDGEYSLLKREFSDSWATKTNAYLTTKKLANFGNYTDKVWHIRAAYAVPIHETQFIEPALLYTEFDGDANSINYPSGKDRILDAGVNWYVNKNNLKLSIHWLSQDGGPVSTFAKKAADAKTGAYKERDDAVVFAVQILY